MNAESQGPVCDYMLSRTLGLCGLYRRNEEQRPEKCWDREFNPCPNNTAHRRPRDAPVPFIASKRVLSPLERRILEEGPEKALEDENEAEVEYA